MDSLNALWGKLGLRNRVLLLAALFLGVGSLPVVLSEMRIRVDDYRERLLQEMEITMDLLDISIGEQATIGDYATIQKILDSRAYKPMVDRIAWQDREGIILQATGMKAVAVFPDWFGKLADLKPLSQSRGILVGGEYYGTLSVRFSTVDLGNRVWQGWPRQLLEILFFVVASLAIIWIVLRDNLLPLEGIAALARGFLAGDYQVKVPVYPRLAPEVRATLDMVNQATGRVRRLLLSLSAQRSALNNAAIVAECDTQGIITYVNDKFCKISGYSRQEVLGLTHRFLNSGRHPARFFVDMWATLKEGRVWRGEICNRDKNGGLFWVDTTITPIIGADGKPEKYIGVRFDVTESKLAKAALLASEENYRRIVETAQEGIWVLDVNGVAVYVNRRMAEMLGYEINEMLESSLFEFMHESVREGAQQKWERHIREVNERQDICFRHKNGAEVWTMISTNVIFDDAGRVAGILWMVADITERRQTEMEIKESREQLRQLSSHLQRAREEEKARIAREIHDELGGTLTALKMDIFWLTRKLPQNLAPLLSKTDTMSALVDSAVQTTRRICTELRPTILDDLGLVAAIEWQVREYEIRTGIECVLHLDESGISPDGDGSIALFRILQESFTNIIRHAHATRVEIALHREGDNIMMQIKDNGVGISEDKVLNPLSHGIRGMIERAWDLGGALSVSDAPGRGTVIYALIPSPQREKAGA